MNSVNLSQAIGTSPGAYGNLSDAPPFAAIAPRSVAAFPVGTTKGRRGVAKVSSREDFIAEYGHNPTFSLTTYGPLFFLQESNRVVVSRVLHNAKEAGAMLDTIGNSLFFVIIGAFTLWVMYSFFSNIKELRTEG